MPVPAPGSPPVDALLILSSYRCTAAGCPPGVARGPSQADFNLETLTYFHHFITITSLTLPSAEDPQSAKYYWQMHVIRRALRRRWLMCGLLAISAHYLAALADDTMTKRIHCERQVQFCSEFSTGLGLTTGCDSGLEAAEIEEETKKTGEQIRCLLHCTQRALAEATVDYDSVAPCHLVSIVSTARGCVFSDPTFRYTGIRDDGHSC